MNWIVILFQTRFDFVLEAKEKAGIYQMRFAGLFDCAKYGAHGLGLLIYDNLINNQVSIYKNIK